MNSNLSCSAILLTVIISFMLLSVSALADTPDGGSDNAVAGTEDTQTETHEETEGGSASVSENRIEITCEKSSLEDRRVQIMVRACAKGHSIDLIQAENTGSGIRKTLFLASPDDEKKESAEAGFAATANGIYSFYAFLARKNTVILSGRHILLYRKSRAKQEQDGKRREQHPGRAPVRGLADPSSWRREGDGSRWDFS